MLPDLAVAIDVRAAGGTHPGKLRARNEDRFHVDASRGIFVVVDGIGGQAGGARAAEIALDAVRRRLERETASLPERLREAIASANEAIRDEAQLQPEIAGMGCVLTAVVIAGERIVAGHVGDTRLYKLHNGHIVKLTRDHSPVGDLEDTGRLAEHEAMRHPRRNEVWRSVGSDVHRPEDPGFIDIVEDTFPADAALLLCTDGLTDLVDSAEIAAAIHRHAGSPADAVEQLIQAANDAGGRDNVTAVVVEGSEFGRTHFAAGPAKTMRQGARDASRTAALFVLGAAVAVLALTSPLPRSVARVRPVVPSVETVAARTLTVGGPEADARSIGAALETARPGDTILVQPGTYRESLALREGVTLVSAQRHAAELRRPADHAGAWTAVTIAGVTSATIRGFRIVGTDAEPLDVGVRVTDGDPAIEDLDVAGARDAAVRITGTSAATVHGSVLHDNPGFGVRVLDSSAPEITNTAVVRNGRGAIEVARGAQPVLLWNVVQHANRPR